MMQYPEDRPPDFPASDISEHLKPVWQNIRNEIAHSQQVIRSRLDLIKVCKREISYSKSQIMAKAKALAALEGVKDV